MNPKSLSRLRAIVLSKAGKTVRRVAKQTSRAFGEGARTQAIRALKTGQRVMNNTRTKLYGEGDVLRRQATAERSFSSISPSTSEKFMNRAADLTTDAIRTDIKAGRASNRAIPVAEKLIKNQRRAKKAVVGTVAGLGVAGAAAIGTHQVVKRVNNVDRKLKKHINAWTKEQYPDIKRKDRKQMVNERFRQHNLWVQNNKERQQLTELYKQLKKK